MGFFADDVWRSPPRDTVLESVRQNGLLLKSLPRTYADDHEVVLAAVTNSGQALEYVSEQLRADRDIVLTAVARKGWVLLYASPELRGDRDVVLAAVSQDGSALWYASEELKADREVVMAAVKQKGWALMYASKELRQDRDVVYAAWCSDHQALVYAAEDMQSKTPRFRYLSGEQCHFIDGKVCGKNLVGEVKRQIEEELRCRVELMHDGKLFAEQEDRPLATLGEVDVQIVKLPALGDQGGDPSSGYSGHELH